MDKTKRKNKSDYGEYFIPPDGGWGWLVCIASGLTSICMFPIFQQFGLIFRDKLLALDLSNKEITSIINTHFAVSQLSGFFNGYIFRKYSYRGVALISSVLVISGIYFMIYTENFMSFMLIFALYLGIGKGFLISAKQVAFLTYFKKNRRRALSIIVTLPAIGQIIMPYLATFLMFQYGIKGTLLIFCGIAMHLFAASLIYQPVRNHIKKQSPFRKSNSTVVCVFCGLRNQNELKQHSTHNFLFHESNEKFCNCSEIKTLKTTTVFDNNTNELQNAHEGKEMEQQIKRQVIKKPTIQKRVTMLLNLDLLRDKTFINISFGMTCTMFVEQNFNILAPFFLSDFGYSYNQITFAMSFTRVPDLISRILTPYVVQKLKWKNRTLWLICVMVMTITEIAIARKPSFVWIVALMFIGGIFRGSKMIFNGMLIPDYVPLKIMPAALGLNRMLSGILMLSLGPIIGLIRDKSDYQMALIFLNFISIIPITLWAIEFYCKKKSKHLKAVRLLQNNNKENLRNEKHPMLLVN